MPPSVLVAAPVKIVRLTSGPVRVVRTVAARPVRVLSVAQQGRPGSKGDQGERGLPGSVAGSIPWEQITGRPVLALVSDLITEQTDVFPVQTDGPQTLHLRRVPQNNVSLYINGLFQTDLTGIQLSGTVMELSAAWRLFTGDTLAVRYGYLP